MKRVIVRAAAVAATGLMAMAFAAAPASAGTQVVTGDDEHCEHGSESPGICDATRKYLEYARGGAPNPNRPILAIDCGSEDRGGGAGPEYIEAAYDQDPPIYTVCPGTDEYDEVEFTTDDWSVIAVGTGEASSGNDDPRGTSNGPLNARKDDFQRFFDQGGGIATFNAARGGRDEDLDFLPLDVELREDIRERSDGVERGEGGAYYVTPAGRAELGVTDEEVSAECCMHEAYEEPDGPLKVGVRDGGGNQTRGAGAPDPAIVVFGRSGGGGGGGGDNDGRDDDLDDDGLPNQIEAGLGTDPQNPDTDFDGIIDTYDQCPTLAGPGIGCPAPVTVVQQQSTSRALPTGVSLDVDANRGGNAARSKAARAAQNGGVTVRSSGTIGLPAGVDASSCAGGRVAVLIKRGERTISGRVVNLRADCSYRSTVTFRRKLGKSLRVKSYFFGSIGLVGRAAKMKVVSID